MISCQCLRPCFQPRVQWRRSCNHVFRPSMDRYLIRKLDYFDWTSCCSSWASLIWINMLSSIPTTHVQENTEPKHKQAPSMKNLKKLPKCCWADVLTAHYPELFCEEEFELLISLKAAIWGFRQAEKYEKLFFQETHCCTARCWYTDVYWIAFTLALTPLYNIYSARPNFN